MVNVVEMKLCVRTENVSAENIVVTVRRIVPTALTNLMTAVSILYYSH